MRRDPDYPLTPIVLMPGGIGMTVICVRQENGEFLAMIAEKPAVRYVSIDRKAARDGVIRMYRALAANPVDVEEIERLEDEEDIRVIKTREGEPMIPLEEVLRRHGKPLAAPSARKRGKRSR